MNTDYAKLDAAILNKIGAAPKQFALINVRDVAEECKRISKEIGTSRSHYGVEPFRILDRRLQALRKSGKILSTGKGWIRTTDA
jgi:hypothetical protein